MIRLLEITYANMEDICDLEVFDDQKNFLLSNVFSLAEAFSLLNERIFVKPFGVCDEDTLIGFVMVGYGTISDPDEPKVADGNYIMWRFMIDKKYQGKGYAKPILDKVMEYIRTFPAKPAEKIWLSYEKENERARKIYRDYGFVENGEICADEIVAVYDL